jgi:hypothetical protein
MLSHGLAKMSPSGGEMRSKEGTNVLETMAMGATIAEGA